MNGSCLCGAVRWETEAPARDPIACHCTQCRKQSGHYWTAARVPVAGLSVEGEVRWFQASPAARRGFCPDCGSFLFWQPLDDGRPAASLSLALGAVDGPTGLTTKRHIYVDEKGDYYAIADGLPQEEGWQG